MKKIGFNTQENKETKLKLKKGEGVKKADPVHDLLRQLVKERDDKIVNLNRNNMLLSLANSDFIKAIEGYRVQIAELQSK